MPGDHVLVGILLHPSQHPQNAPAPIYVRNSDGRSLSAIDIRTLHNNNNIHVRESRCYIPLSNGTVLMAFLESNIYTLYYPTSAIVTVRFPEYNNTLYSGELRFAQGYRPVWLPLS